MLSRKTSSPVGRGHTGHGINDAFWPNATESLAVSTSSNIQEPTSSHPPEVEVSEYRGVKLVPIRTQGNNAIKGAQSIDKEAYRLKVTGLVENEFNLNYSQILELTPLSAYWLLLRLLKAPYYAIR